jgi:hypothetical protein
LMNGQDKDPVSGSKPVTEKGCQNVTVLLSKKSQNLLRWVSTIHII